MMVENTDWMKPNGTSSWKRSLIEFTNICFGFFDFAQKSFQNRFFCAGSTHNYGYELAVDVERESSRGGVNADWRTRPGVVGEVWGRYRDLTSVSVAMCSRSSSVIWVKPRIADSARSRCMAPSMAVKTALGS